MVENLDKLKEIMEQESSEEETEEVLEETPVEVDSEETTEEKSVADEFEKMAEDAIEGIDQENPLSEMSIKNIENMLKNVEGMLQTFESLWKASATELDLTMEHMKQLAVLNANHADPMPEHLTDKQKDEWDYANGIDKLTDEEIDSVFPEGHKVRGVDHSQTIDRIKGAFEDYLNWMRILVEYRNIQKAYMALIESQEDANIMELKKVAEAEEDPEKKEAMLKSIDLYYNRKYLDFLSEPVDDVIKNSIIKALSDEKQASYLINRCRDKLTKMHISTKFILEVSKFEERFMDEKYHKNSNVLLTYFMNRVVYANIDKNEDEKVKVISMILTIDRCIQKILPKEINEKVMNNIIALEDQFIDIVPTK